MGPDPDYRIDSPETILSPAVVVFRPLVESNMQTMLQIAGGPRRLRPHAKTHKTAEIVRRWVELGVTRHKCATFAEAEVAVQAGAEDVLLAYNLVGPNISRAADFVRRFPGVRLSVTADDPASVVELSQHLAARNLTLDVMVDIDSGQHRTGAPPGPAAVQLYRLVAASAGLQAAGLHLYDGQNHQRDLRQRTAAVEAVWESGRQLADELEREDCRVPALVAGGTGSFPIFARHQDPRLQLSPGTCVFHDQGYLEAFPDLPFTPAALLFTRVISRPTPDRLTLDLGYKAVAADPPAGQRVHFPALPDAVQELHNEEHLVLRTPLAADYRCGDWLLAIPRHICPTSALHEFLYVIDGGKLVDRWMVRARDRRITV